MKKIVGLIVGLITALSIAESSTFADAGGIQVNVNGNSIDFNDQEPVIVDGTTLIPLRAVSEELGYDTEWDQENKTVTVSDGKSIIFMRIGDYVMTVNGYTQYLSVAPQIINERTMVPVRAISEAFGCVVDWDGDYQTVHIVTGGVPYVYYLDYDDSSNTGDMVTVVECNEFITLRETPSYSAEVITEIPLFNFVTFLADMQNGFCAVRYRGHFGYVGTKYIDPYEAQMIMGQAKVIKCRESVTMRTSASTSAEEIQQVPLDAVVSVVGNMPGTDFGPYTINGFTLVLYNGFYGWVLTDYLSV